MKKQNNIYSCSNTRGITLVALVITIIVLLILAGLSIMALIGDNGIVSRAQESAKKQDISGDVEKIKLSLDGYKASEYNSDYTETFEDYLKNEYGQDNVFGIGNDEYVVTIEKCGHQYVVKKDGTIEETKLEKSYFDAIKDKIVYYESGSNQGKINLQETKNNIENMDADYIDKENIEIVDGKLIIPIIDGPTIVINGAIDYLAEIAEIGDYVNIDLNSGYSGGWRVLDKSGKTNEDTVTLISAQPLMNFNYGRWNVQNAIELLNNMNKITITKTGEGFISDSITGAKNTDLDITDDSPTKEVDLQAYFMDSSNGNCYKYFDNSKPIHAFCYGELEKTYDYITGQNATIATIKYKQNIGNDNSLKNALVEGKEWNNRWNGIFHMNDYYIAGDPGVEGRLADYKSSMKGFYGSYGISLPIRMVITLQPGVMVESGTGESLVSQYNLTK